MTLFFLRWKVNNQIKSTCLPFLLLLRSLYVTSCLSIFDPARTETVDIGHLLEFHHLGRESNGKSVLMIVHGIAVTVNYCMNHWWSIIFTSKRTIVPKSKIFWVQNVLDFIIQFAAGSSRFKLVGKSVSAGSVGDFVEKWVGNDVKTISQGCSLNGAAKFHPAF